MLHDPIQVVLHSWSISLTTETPYYYNNNRLYRTSILIRSTSGLCDPYDKGANCVTIP